MKGEEGEGANHFHERRLNGLRPLRARKGFSMLDSMAAEWGQARGAPQKGTIASPWAGLG